MYDLKKTLRNLMEGRFFKLIKSVERRDRRIVSSRTAWAASGDPVSNNQRLGCSSVVEHLPSMCKALGSIPIVKKKYENPTH
jgi:hypothetical protein